MTLKITFTNLPQNSSFFCTAKRPRLLMACSIKKSHIACGTVFFIIFLAPETRRGKKIAINLLEAEIIA